MSSDSVDPLAFWRPAEPTVEIGTSQCKSGNDLDSSNSLLGVVQYDFDFKTVLASKAASLDPARRREKIRRPSTTPADETTPTPGNQVPPIPPAATSGPLKLWGELLRCVCRPVRFDLFLVLAKELIHVRAEFRRGWARAVLCGFAQILRDGAGMQRREGAGRRGERRRGERREEDRGGAARGGISRLLLGSWSDFISSIQSHHSQSRSLIS